MKTMIETIKKCLWVVGLLSLSVSAFATLQEQTNMKFNGNYDVKMVSSVGLQPAWVSTASPMTVVDMITNEQMYAAGDLLSLNNRFDLTTSNVKDAVLNLIPAGATMQAMVYADCDDDMSTFQSSAAFLDFGDNMSCTTIEAAYLYWSGVKGNTTYAAYPGTQTMKSHAGGAWGNLNTFNQVKFKTPGMTNYVDVQSNRRVDEGTGDRYVFMADVTQHVKGKTGGLYWVANICSGSEKGDGGASCGWSLIVVYTYPNCPQRVIKFWDNNGTASAGNGSTITLNFGANEVPASGNAISYLGFMGLDGEDSAPLLMSKDNTSAGIKSIAEKNRIVFNGGNGDKIIQPFVDDQGPVHACDKKSVCIDDAYHGFVSSQMTTYDPESGKNGNQIVRLPNNEITLGYDAHHVKLPANSMKGGATSATMKLPDEQNGDWSVHFAYMAIETQQAILQMSKRAEEGSTKPDQELNYILTIENIGTKASIGTSTVRDTLDKTLDFIEGSAQFIDKAGNPITSGVSCTAINVGADNNEVVTFTIPEVAAGDGAKANDSIRIKFKVKVKGYDRTDIWAYGCNRQVKNRAVLIYKNDAGLDVEAGSNSTGGCDGQSVYYYTPVMDASLDEQYYKTHQDTLDLAGDPDAGNKLVVTTLRSHLADLIAKLGLTAEMPVDAFTFYFDGVEVSATEKFDITGGALDYIAVANLGNGCEETFYFNVKVAKRPTVEVEKAEDDLSGKTGADAYTKKAGASDATISISIANGNAPYFCVATDALGNIICSAYVEGDALGNGRFSVQNVSKGDYTMTVTDAKGFSVSKTVKVDDPDIITVDLSGETTLCKYQQLNLNATISGRTGEAANRLQYVWQYSTDNGTTWNNIATDKNLSTQLTTSGKYRLAVCETNPATGSGAQYDASVNVNSVLTPELKTLAGDTACSEYPLPTYTDGTIYVFENESDPGFATSDVALRFFNHYPTSADEAPDYTGTLKQSKTVFAQLIADGKCYSVDTISIYVKSMEECYPVSIPEFFSPDGDDINDLFRIDLVTYDLQQGAEVYKDPEIKIYDRYGKEVYRGNKEDISNGWDGKYNGQDLPSGDYWYQMTFKEIRPKVGHFSLKRRKK